MDSALLERFGSQVAAAFRVRAVPPYRAWLLSVEIKQLKGSSFISRVWGAASGASDASGRGRCSRANRGALKQMGLL